MEYTNVNATSAMNKENSHQDPLNHFNSQNKNRSKSKTNEMMRGKRKPTSLQSNMFAEKSVGLQMNTLVNEDKANTETIPAIRKISRLSGTIAKFEQNVDGPKTTWKSFIRPQRKEWTNNAQDKAIATKADDSTCNEVEFKNQNKNLICGTAFVKSTSKTTINKTSKLTTKLLKFGEKSIMKGTKKVKSEEVPFDQNCQQQSEVNMTNNKSQTKLSVAAVIHNNNNEISSNIPFIPADQNMALVCSTASKIDATAVILTNISSSKYGMPIDVICPFSYHEIRLSLFNEYNHLSGRKNYPPCTMRSDYLSKRIKCFLEKNDYVKQKQTKTYELKKKPLVRSHVPVLDDPKTSFSFDGPFLKNAVFTYSHPYQKHGINVVYLHVEENRKLSEVTSELTEEHSTSNLISERLEAETKERMKLQKDVEQQHMKYKSLQESSEKMEMELLCAKSDLSGDLDDVLENDVGVNVYKVKYERAMRELEFTKKRLQTQHEHDLEQLVGLKKQLEKKLANAYEEVEEQRQVVSDWKRKAQKMTNEMNDLRMLLDEQSSRNNLLEKRHRKFDSETQALQDTIRQEKQMREKLAREKDFLFAEKSTLEQTLSDVRLELELKEEKYSVLQQELAEMTFDGVTEEEIGLLKRQKMELVRRCKEQEEELDEMAAQIQMLEQVKLRLEMSLETFRKQTRKEAQQREDEVEETRSNCYKKIKSLECQLEQEHEERTLMMREKHELERRLRTLEENDRIEQATEESTIQKLKRELRKTKALLRDTQSQLDRIKSESVVKTQLRHLRNQLEDAEMARCAALKARKIAENELQDVQLILEETQRARVDAHEKANTALRERSDLQAQIDENEEEMAELMKKYSATIKQLSCDQDIISEYEIRITELESEKKSLKENILELTSRLATVESLGESSSNIIGKRFELRNKELESRLEFEQATRMRIEIQLNRQKESFEKALNEMSQIRSKEISVQEALKKSQKIVRELREEVSILTSKEQENISQRKSLEKQVESLESECNSTRADLRLALQRISDLQQAMEEDGSYHSESDVESTTDSENVFSIHSPINDMLYPKESGNLDYSSNDKNSGIYTRETEENFARSPSLPTQAIT